MYFHFRMVNTYRKGWKTVNEGRKMLVKDGWVTADVEAKGRFIKQKDLFGLFDVIAIKPNRTKLIQFKTNQMPSYKPYHIFAKEYPQFEVEIWCKINYKGWRIKQIK
ncbi:hypothetical protein CMI37_29820 [Candidatus Pacearchaeota archaeon]|nr:hypothetical protein [Candidatus Pacearchaeota archaeon]|tara:strand:- start:2085 stop:2405 length:321 start_codon:yes stop_codon:yes gene_type:complete